MFGSRIPFLDQHLFYFAARVREHAAVSSVAARPQFSVLLVASAVSGPRCDHDESRDRNNAAMRGTAPGSADGLANRPFVDI